jgi:hypothetical protein
MTRRRAEDPLCAMPLRHELLPEQRKGVHRLQSHEYQLDHLAYWPRDGDREDSSTAVYAESSTVSSGATHHSTPSFYCTLPLCFPGVSGGLCSLGYMAGRPLPPGDGTDLDCSRYRSQTDLLLSEPASRQTARRASRTTGDSIGASGGW